MIKHIARVGNSLQNPAREGKKSHKGIGRDEHRFQGDM
jgi:hypothetical protein